MYIYIYIPEVNLTDTHDLMEGIKQQLPSTNVPIEVPRRLVFVPSGHVSLGDINEEVIKLHTASKPQRATHDVSTTTPQRVAHDVSTTTPQRVTHDVSTATPQRVTHDVSTTTPQRVTHDMSTSTPQRLTNDGNRPKTKIVSKKNIEPGVRGNIRTLSRYTEFRQNACTYTSLFTL